MKGSGTIYEQQMLCIQGEGGDFWATPTELYRRGYRLVAAKPATWDLWERSAYAPARADGRMGVVQ